MNLFARGCAVLIACCQLAVWPLHAAEPKAATAAMATTIDAHLVGHYYLSGIMETGSELLLRPDGRFQWYLSYGALDLVAEGHWHRDGGHVVLEPDAHAPAESAEPGLERMQLRIDGDDLVPAWPWDDGAERGRYSRE